MFQQILKADWIINNLYLKIIYYHISPLVTCIRLGTFLLENKKAASFYEMAMESI